jgi:hypothetical protein
MNGEENIRPASVVRGDAVAKGDGMGQAKVHIDKAGPRPSSTVTGGLRYEGDNAVIVYPDGSKVTLPGGRTGLASSQPCNICRQPAALDTVLPAYPLPPHIKTACSFLPKHLVAPDLFTYRMTPCGCSFVTPVNPMELRQALDTLLGMSARTPRNLLGIDHGVDAVSYQILIAADRLYKMGAKVPPETWVKVRAAVRADSSHWAMQNGIILPSILEAASQAQDRADAAALGYMAGYKMPFGLGTGLPNGLTMFANDNHGENRPPTAPPLAAPAVDRSPSYYEIANYYYEMVNYYGALAHVGPSASKQPPPSSRQAQGPVPAEVPPEQYHKQFTRKPRRLLAEEQGSEP